MHWSARAPDQPPGSRPGLDRISWVIANLPIRARRCLKLGQVDTQPPIDCLTCEAIRARLAPLGEPGSPATEMDGMSRVGLRRAAVLLPLYRDRDGWRLIFIRRAEHAADRHSGEVGFPGGGHEQHDPDCASTALREAEEEIGLAPPEVRLLGQLSPFCTVSRYLVTPVVGCVPWPQPLRADGREVARVFSIPLAWLADPAHHRIRTYPAPGHPQARDLIFFDPYDGEQLWGVSARITVDLLARIRPAPRA